MARRLDEEFLQNLRLRIVRESSSLIIERCSSPHYRDSWLVRLGWFCPAMVPVWKEAARADVLFAGGTRSQTYNIYTAALGRDVIAFFELCLTDGQPRGLRARDRDEIMCTFVLSLPDLQQRGRLYARVTEACIEELTNRTQVDAADCMFHLLRAE